MVSSLVHDNFIFPTLTAEIDVSLLLEAMSLLEEDYGIEHGYAL